MSSNLTPNTTQLIVSLAGIIVAYGIYKISALIYNELTSPLRYVPGPPNPSLVHGNIKQLSESVSHKGSYYLVVIGWTEWTEKFRVYKNYLKATNYILFNSYDYPKPEDFTYSIRQLFGDGAFLGVNSGMFLLTLVWLYKGFCVCRRRCSQTPGMCPLTLHS